MTQTKKKIYVTPETYKVELTEEHDVLVQVSGGNIENPGDGGEDWGW